MECNYIKASERLPIMTNGFSKQILTKWNFQYGESQLRVMTINEFLDAVKFISDSNKIEWLEGDY